MKIIRSRKFTNSLLGILRHISKDKISASKRFEDELNKQIKSIPHFPYKHRQSIYFDDKNIRDLIFKGYTIIYEINTENNTIEILDIFNRNKPAS
jgi:plasmid stabilization system protein ParE